MSSSWVNSTGIFLALTPVQLLALTAYGEAGKEGDASIVAVMNVIRNRTRDVAHKSQFVDSEILSLTGGSLYHAVILKYKQFSMYNPDDPVRPKAEIFASDWQQAVTSGNQWLTKCYTLAGQFINGQLTDNTKGATYYHATYVSPSWAPEKEYIGQIGAHIFYKDKGTQVANGGGNNNGYSPIVLDTSLSPLFWAALIGAGGLLFLFYSLSKSKKGATYAFYD